MSLYFCVFPQIESNIFLNFQFWEYLTKIFKSTKQNVLFHFFLSNDQQSLNNRQNFAISL